MAIYFLIQQKLTELQSNYTSIEKKKSLSSSLVGTKEEALTTGFKALQDLASSILSSNISTTHS